MAIIYGTNGDDSLNGTARADDITSYLGNDTINSGAGNDKIYSLGGNSMLFIDAGSGNDIVNVIGGYADIEGGNGRDQIYVFGTGEKFIDGGVGGDWIKGSNNSASINHMDGGAGGDEIEIRGGTNYVDGGQGNDLIIVGGQAANSVNTLIGGAHNDTFYISTYPASSSQILDFAHNHDKISIGGVAYNSLIVAYDQTTDTTMVDYNHTHLVVNGHLVADDFI